VHRPSPSGGVAHQRRRLARPASDPDDASVVSCRQARLSARVPSVIVMAVAPVIVAVMAMLPVPMAVAVLLVVVPRSVTGLVLS
jgi:hypothetical protein